MVKSVDAPPGFQECGNPWEREEKIKRNIREILQLFNIRVLVYPERVEIKGAIPTQILDKMTKEEPESRPALIISSPSLGKGGGSFPRGASPLLDSPFRLVSTLEPILHHHYN